MQCTVLQEICVHGICTSAGSPGTGTLCLESQTKQSPEMLESRVLGKTKMLTVERQRKKKGMLGHG